jgi:subtilisin family serine protease
MLALDLVKLTALMKRTSGSPAVRIGFIDGPVASQHPSLARGRLKELPSQSGGCRQIDSAACRHGTFVVGILAGTRNSAAPAICPDCTVIVRRIFVESAQGKEQMPATTPRELAAAILDCVDAGVRIINLSLALARSSTSVDATLEQAFNHALNRGVIVVAAAGNQGLVTSSQITRHSWIIPVVACDLEGRPKSESNLGTSIARRGLMAPGDAITSLGADGPPLTLGGTSVAVPFVTGAIALLASVFPAADAAQLKSAITQASKPRRSVVPPLLDAGVAYQCLLSENTTG